MNIIGIFHIIENPHELKGINTPAKSSLSRNQCGPLLIENVSILRVTLGSKIFPVEEASFVNFYK